MIATTQHASAPSGPPLLEIRGVSKIYRGAGNGPVAALEGIDLRVRSGEMVCLTGPTGCGKTTLLNLVAGLDQPDAGTIERHGGLGARGNVPCVFQHYTLFPWRSASGNVEFALQMRGLAGRARRGEAGRLLGLVGLGGFERALPHELSGGMRQRAALAQALAAGAELLLMDEPFGALDDRTRGELQQALTDLRAERGLTILFVTHNLDEAVFLADRIVAFSPRPGRIVEEIAVNLPRPRDRLSAAFGEVFVHLHRVLAAGGALRQ